MVDSRILIDTLGTMRQLGVIPGESGYLPKGRQSK